MALIYSDSNFSSYVPSCRSSSDGDSGAVEDFISDNTKCMGTPYYWTFDDAQGIFRLAFPDAYVDITEEEENRPCFLHILQEVNTTEAVLAPAEEETTLSWADARPQPEDSPSGNYSEGIVSAMPESTTELTLTAAGESDLKTTSFSRFLAKNLSGAILIPVSDTVTRQALRHRYCPAFPDMKLDFCVGVIGGKPTGWALPVSTDVAVLGTLRKDYPGYRAPTKEDVLSFMLPKKVDQATSTKRGKKQVPDTMCGPGKNEKRPTLRIHNHMRNEALLLSCIEAAGGWSKAIFIAFDVEFALVSHSGLPLPTELAFQHARYPGQPHLPEKEQHFFVHPGYIPDEEKMVSYYTSLRVHGIPFVRANFLRDDYDVMAATIRELYIDDPHVILLCKGSATSPSIGDLQSLRWFSAAAASLVEERQAAPEVPAIESLRCFDSDVFTGLIRKISGRDASQPSIPEEVATTSEKGGFCWYHKEMQKQFDLLQSESLLHCAHMDASRLSQAVETHLRLLSTAI